jgi:hypothetical protein
MAGDVQKVGIIALVVLALTVMSAESAQARKKFSTLVPLTGTVAVSGDRCVPAGESVTISSGSKVQVVAVRVGKASGNAPNPHNIHTNMAGVMGVGETTGDDYIGQGSHRFTDVTQPINGTLTLCATYRLVHTNGCAHSPLPVKFVAVFSGGDLQTLTATAGETCE